MHALSLVRHIWGPCDVRVRLTLEGDGKSPLSRAYLPLVLCLNPKPLASLDLSLFLFSCRFRLWDRFPVYVVERFPH
jgi:hypothetical protein